MISVFGSTGFIGGNYCRMYPNSSIAIPREARSPKTEDVLYFISTTHNYNVFEDLLLDINTNLNILMETLKNCKTEHITFNFISSWFVYGHTVLPAKEISHCEPRGFYSITKKCAEDLLISFCRTFNISYRILRLCNVYGGNDIGVSKKKNALQFLIEKMKSNEDIELYHSGEFFRDYMHVNDVCRAIKLIVSSGNKNEIYNVGSGEPTKFKDIIEHAYTILDSKSIIRSIDPPVFHDVVQVRNMCLDTSKLKQLGFEKSISIEDGIANLCQ